LRHGVVCHEPRCKVTPLCWVLCSQNCTALGRAHSPATLH